VRLCPEIKAERLRDIVAAISGVTLTPAMAAERLMTFSRVAVMSGVKLEPAIFASRFLVIVAIVSDVVLWTGIEVINDRTIVAEISGVMLDPVMFAIRLMMPAIVAVISGV